MQKQWKPISGWGNYPTVKALVITPATISQLQQAVVENSVLIARGGGNSYGDSSLYTTIISTKLLNAIISQAEDWIEVQAGITIETLLQHIVPQKKFLPVTPGTQSVTIGGAIASDVHGKNHLQGGSFFNSAISLQLINEKGELVTCSRQENSQLFYNCFGGMGLSGIIVSAIIRLVPLPSVWMKEEQHFAAGIRELLLLMEANRTAPYLVAWMDMLGTGTKGVVKTARWQNPEELPGHSEPFAGNPHKVITVLFKFPFPPPAFAFRWYNKRYLSRAQKHPTQLLHYTQFFYPLDSIKNWKYIFGPKGLLQYHFVLPLPVAEKSIAEIINMVKNSKAVCTLAVIKLFGKGNPETPYAFAREGYNMALDFIHTSYAVSLIARLDDIVRTLGGTVYKTKDAFSNVPSAIESTKFQSLQNARYAQP